MSLHTRVIKLDHSGLGTVGVPPSRLAALQGGSVSNRGHSFAAGDSLEDAETFVSGPLVAHGAADSTVTLWIDYSL